eukprot:12868223-Alexandrium_andersonii.AAC.1
MLVVKQRDDDRNDGASVCARPNWTTSSGHDGTQDDVRPLQHGNLRARRDRQALVEVRQVREVVD